MKLAIPDCIAGQWRLISEKDVCGPDNTARDVALVRSVEKGSAPALRLYSFEPSCITFGKFQNIDGSDIYRKCIKSGIDFTRRPTGGLAIFHSDDFTYSVSIPHDKAPAQTQKQYFTMVAGAVIESLGILGIRAEIVSHKNKNVHNGWCFGSEFGVDIEYKGRKICGSAQKIYKHSVLQHGSVFLRAGVNRIERHGIRDNEITEGGATTFMALNEAGGREYAWEDVSEAFEKGFSRFLGIETNKSALSESEEETALQLSKERYGNIDWVLGGT